MVICSNPYCRLPLEDSRDKIRRISGRDVCQTCFDLHEAVADRPDFKEAHEKWVEQMKQLDRMRPGRDYFA